MSTVARLACEMVAFSEQWLAEYQARSGRLPTARESAPAPAPSPETTSITLALSVPPSVNEMFANVPGKGRVKTKKYRTWRKIALDEARLGMLGKGRIKGYFTATIWVTLNVGADLDNKCKAVLDLCKTVGAITDDKRCIALHAYRVLGKSGLWITLEKTPEPHILATVPIDVRSATFP